VGRRPSGRLMDREEPRNTSNANENACVPGTPLDPCRAKRGPTRGALLRASLLLSDLRVKVFEPCVPGRLRAQSQTAHRRLTCRRTAEQTHYNVPMIRKAAVAACAALALFHLWLLVEQAWAGELLEPWLLLRWLVAGVLAAGLVSVLRSGASGFWSRRTVALWVLGAILHGPLLMDRVGVDTQGLPEAAAILVQIATLSAAASAVILLAAAFRRTPRTSRSGRDVSAGVTLAPSRSLGFVQAFAPRPPPLH
jgi:hypothetical protein